MIALSIDATPFRVIIVSTPLAADCTTVRTLEIVVCPAVTEKVISFDRDDAPALASEVTVTVWSPDADG